MFRKGTRFPAGTVLLLFGLGAAGIAIGAGQAGTAAGPVRCEIRVDSTNGTTRLEGVVHADKAVSGSYRLRVNSSGASGRSNIDQGGDFTAGPGNPAMLGSVALDAPGARLDASLTITVNGKTIECADQTHGAI